MDSDEEEALGEEDIFLSYTVGLGSIAATRRERFLELLNVRMAQPLSSRGHVNDGVHDEHDG